MLRGNLLLATADQYAEADGSPKLSTAKTMPSSAVGLSLTWKSGQLRATTRAPSRYSLTNTRQREQIVMYASSEGTTWRNSSSRKTRTERAGAGGQFVPQNRRSGSSRAPASLRHDVPNYLLSTSTLARSTMLSHCIQYSMSDPSSVRLFVVLPLVRRVLYSSSEASLKTSL